MANTYKRYLQTVFVVKSRENFIHERIREKQKSTSVVWCCYKGFAPLGLIGCWLLGPCYREYFTVRVVCCFEYLTFAEETGHPVASKHFGEESRDTIEHHTS